MNHAKPSELFCDGNFIKQQIQDFTLVNFGNNQTNSTNDLIKFNIHPQPSFNKQFNLLIENLNEYHKAGFTNYIFCANDQQAKRFKDIFDDIQILGEVTLYQNLLKGNRKIKQEFFSKVI